MADHRVRVRSSEIGAFAMALAQRLRARGVNLPVGGMQMYGDHAFDERWMDAVADELTRHRGACLVVAGRQQPPNLHALVFAINNGLGNIGKTIEYCEYADAALPRRADLKSLTAGIHAGSVETLVVLGGNPVYGTPVDAGFAAAFGKAGETIHLASHYDETSREAKWHLPRAHLLESWGDARAADGTLSVVQPLIEPLFGGHSDIEVASLLVSGRDRRGYELVREAWKNILPAVDYEKTWQRVLHDGILAGSETPRVQPALDAASVTQALSDKPLPQQRVNGLDLSFTASPTLYDGRFANNGWLQELPDTVTKITWDNAAIISSATAENLGLKSGDVVRLSVDERAIELPVWIQPGHADDAVSLSLGYGRTAAGRVGTGVGVNAFQLQSQANPDIISGARITPALRTHALATTQNHGSMEGRPIVREATLDELRLNPDFADEMAEHPPLQSLWQEHDYGEGYQWGMSIDLNACTGCSACTIACQSENNIPIVGAEQVSRGREMHWIRIDRYYTGDGDNPDVVHQPVACQHCENAPCEQVCPVAATMHSEDGLNTMVYNRCIGTRYCSNNCPYKVRRFNFFNYTKDTPELVKMAMNPNVTVRFRGVMEKCTYCVQRISRARIVAKEESRDIADGELVSACQQACPADAIVFGNINNPNSRVSQMKKRDRRYELLAELNVKPRTSYRAKLRNPNPKLA
jgi:molybdopterin-containing oxidoreductase family iron-sulfur binding subunit